MKIQHTKPTQFTREIILHAPVNGSRLDWHQLNAPLFEAGIWGPAMPFRYSGHTLYAPDDCVIESVPETGYEVSFKTRLGLRIFINLLPFPHHLMGEKCERKVRVGQSVKAGTELMTFQPQWLKQRGFSLHGVLAIKNGDKCKALMYSHQKQFIALDDPLIHIYL